MAQTQLYTKKAQVGVKEEVTVDTFAVPTSSEMFLAEDVEVTIDSANYETNYHREDYFTMDDVPGLKSGTISFTVPLKGSGTAGTAPEYDEALKACGLEVTNVPGASDTYAPLSTFDGAGGNPGQSYSVDVKENGVRYAVKGAFGNCVITGEVGQPLKARFTFTGAYVAVADDALESPTYQTTAAPCFKGATFAINFGGAHTPIAVENFVLDLGNQIALRNDVNDATGVMGARITSRRSFGSFDPEMQLVATFDYFGTQHAGTTGTVATGTIGGTAGNQVAISIARAVLRPLSLQDRNGIRALEIPFSVTSAVTDTEGTNDDITIAFT